MNFLFSVFLGFILDLIFGDPHFMPHPIRLIGSVISKGEKIIRKIMPKKEYLGGAILSIFVILSSFFLPL